MYSFACDVHTHTLWSRHAYSTVEENVRAAADAKLELIGITEHYSDMLHPTLDIRDYQYFLNFKVWPEIWHGVELMRGVEADIVDSEGHLFGWDVIIEKGITGSLYHEPRMLKDVVFKDCQYVIASIHNKDFTLDKSIAQNTQMYINALLDPKVLILGHIGRSGVNFDFREVIRAAASMNKLIEINEHSLSPLMKEDSYARCLEVAQICVEEGCGMVVSSDAHISCDVGRFERAPLLLEEAHVPQELIVTRSAKAFKYALQRAL